MNYRVIFTILIAAILLAGCAAGGPSNAEAQEVIFGVYMQDAKIIKKSQCDLTPAMEEDGYSNVWLVLYKFEKSGGEGGMLLAESDSEEYPWETYKIMVDSCP
jgi:hypothetical protein